MPTHYQVSPFGEAIHPWLSKADTKFNEGGVFKSGLSVGGPEAIAFQAKVDAAIVEALARFWESDEGKKVPPKEKKLWKAYNPYKVDTDDNDNPTGYIVFQFKQNQTLKLRDGTVKLVKIGIKDASGKKDQLAPVFGGSEIRLMFTFRDVLLKKDKTVGVQLAFAQVQVRKLAASSGGPSFDAVDGDEAQDEAPFDGGSTSGPAVQNSGGDY